MSLGLSALYDDDLAMIERSFLLYDALYAWCRFAADEAHGWPPPDLAAVAAGAAT